LGNFVCAIGHKLQALQEYFSSTMFQADDLSIDMQAFGRGSILSVFAGHNPHET
jgi:hypothetical protein